MQTNSAFPRLNDLFTELEQMPSPSGNSGATQRRIPSKSKCDLFVAVQKPANIRILVTRFSVSALPAEFEIPPFHSLELDEQRETVNNAERLTITLRAPQTAFNDIFASLAEDIARHVGEHTEEETAASSFYRRMIQWQRLLQRQVWNGLSSEEQRGLYGELWQLRELLNKFLVPINAVAAWTGPSGASKDFQFPKGVAVEVKTTLSRQPQTLIISNERQLDDTGLEALYLLHLCVEGAHGAGETLTELIAELRAQLSGDPVAYTNFEEKLVNVGYLDAHASRYQETGYIGRGAHLYRVAAGFPRIIEGDISAGVGDVRYSISASACLPFTAEPAEFLSAIGGKG